MYVNVVFVIRCLYSAVSLTLVREQRFILIINYYHYILSGRSLAKGLFSDGFFLLRFLFYIFVILTVMMMNAASH